MQRAFAGHGCGQAGAIAGGIDVPSGSIRTAQGAGHACEIAGGIDAPGACGMGMAHSHGHGGATVGVFAEQGGVGSAGELQAVAPQPAGVAQACASSQVSSGGIGVASVQEGATAAAMQVDSAKGRGRPGVAD
jgi:hypothetical protein